MEQGFRYMKNEKCKYMPCHKCVDAEEFNCLFCFCPMYGYEDCLGNPKYIEAEDGKRTKDCSDCMFPHIPKNYEKIMDYLSHK